MTSESHKGLKVDLSLLKKIRTGQRIMDISYETHRVVTPALMVGVSTPAGVGYNCSHLMEDRIQTWSPWALFSGRI